MSIVLAIGAGASMRWVTFDGAAFSGWSAPDVASLQ